MIKKERVPIKWEDQEIFCCDNCGEEMRLISYYRSFDESRFEYECPRCGLEVKSPTELPQRHDKYKCPKCSSKDIHILMFQGLPLHYFCKVCGMIGEEEDFLV